MDVGPVISELAIGIRLANLVAYARFSSRPGPEWWLSSRASLDRKAVQHHFCRSWFLDVWPWTWILWTGLEHLVLVVTGVRWSSGFQKFKIYPCLFVATTTDLRGHSLQESWPTAKMTALGTVKNFKSLWVRQRLLLSKFLMGFCSNRSYECPYKIWSS